jgi:hypothetical protein
MDPANVCSPTYKQATGDRLVIKSSKKELNVPLKESEMNSFWTLGRCFYTMGVHYWADTTGQLNKNTNPDHFLPLFLQYNKGIFSYYSFVFMFLLYYVI